MVHQAEHLFFPPAHTYLEPENGASFGNRSLLVQLKILS